MGLMEVLNSMGEVVDEQSSISRAITMLTLARRRRRSIYSASTSWGKMRGYTGRRPIILCTDWAGCPGLRGGARCLGHGAGCPAVGVRFL